MRALLATLTLLSVVTIACDPRKPGFRQPRLSPTPAHATSPGSVTVSDTRRALPKTDFESRFTLFESGQVRPIALSPDGSRLFVANTPDNRLEIFEVDDGGLTPGGSVVVGLEPVAVAARSRSEVWVVNHLSDSVSVVSFPDRPADVRAAKGAMPGRVKRTLLVGDEPRDIVFAGPGRSRAFITAAHRGQNLPMDPELTTPGVGRADVWVYDTSDLGSGIGGTPLTILTLFTDTPRALATTPDASRVYAAGFHTGNRTTVVFEDVVTDNGGLPEPRTDAMGVQQPETGLIVRFDGSDWKDEVGRSWNDAVRFSLPDKDVFVIDANTDPPRQLTGQEGFYQGVGTILFNMIVNPANGELYVSNMEAFNERRFEGRGEFAGQSVRGHLFESRVSLLGVEGVRVRHLNKHIDYSVCCAEIPNEENTRSLAFPTDMAITSDGSQLYVAAFGSSKVGVFDTASLEADTFQPDPASQITVSGGGPSGLALDEARNRLYVLTRFDNSISIIDLESATEVDHVSLFNPEPPHIVDGRRFLYDASFSSSHGDSACASCHIFGDFDSLAWDLGDPDSTTLTNPGPFALHPLQAGSPQTADFRSLKGPMTTQSLRGLANHGPMHWRGDRTGGNEAANLQPDSGSFDEDAAFKKFNVAFEGLLGRHEPLRASDMQAFTDFVLRITYPPNPVRNLDNSLNAEQQAGRDFYFSEQASDGFGNCNRCHVLDPLANDDTGVPSPGFFGTDGRYSFVAETQVFKIPHLRNMYQKIGMFGFPDSAFFDGIEGGEFMGDQVRGVGFLHDGSVDTLFRFHSAGVFTQSLINPGGFPQGPDGDRMRRQVEAFMLVFDTNLAPIVGQQLTVTAETGDASESIGLLMERADARECDLVGRLQTDSRQRGYLYLREGLFQPDGSADPPLDPGGLFEKAAHEKGDLTFTCAPPGSGYRLALDRDEDGYWDADERALGSDLADPSSRPRVTFKSRRKQ